MAYLQPCIASGPLLQSAGLPSPSTSDKMDEWLETGLRLAKQMQMPEDPTLLSDVQRLRIYHYYLPVYFWCRSQIEAHKATGSKQALMVSR